MNDQMLASASVSDLERLANDLWADYEALSRIEHELSRRRTSIAKTLRGRIQARLAQFAPVPRQGASQLHKGTEGDRALRLAQARIAELEAERTALVDEIRYLQQQLEISDLYSEVGLHPNAPDYVVDAARKAYRRKNHPDAQHGATQNQKRVAERRFQEVEELFDKIASTR